MTDLTNSQNGAIWADRAAQTARSDPDIRQAAAQTAAAFATLAVADGLRPLREAVDSFRRAVTDSNGFSSADHLRSINEWVEQIAKA
ncbi:hypothetical protein [Micromonospora saelicesensis]|uniref:hypothetical protein n=1 Tax=Micromonospora saelicesensis TaxID=285676 RepID=UPI000DC602BA|nr:hypothetical protein [Micromonospora saelicesensis]RAO61193.1 hypothetical protein PSN01_01828 [Micromonospora saelicesensis]